MRSRVTVLYTLRLLAVWKRDYAERAIVAGPLPGLGHAIYTMVPSS